MKEDIIGGKMAADMWFNIYYGKIHIDSRGVTKRIVKNDSGEMRVTGFDKGILYHKEILHNMLDIAIERINKEQLLFEKNTDKTTLED